MSPAPGAIATDRARTAAAVALVVAAVCAAYWRALGSGFVGDDFMILHRLRGVTSPGDVLHFFRGDFFEYYRPLGFVSHAIDWTIAGPTAWQFHLTNLLLHGTSTVLVFFIARTLAPRSSVAGPVAALLFGLHASNHEAVVWISARFDLLATCASLAAVLWMIRGGFGSRVGPPILFFAAVLSKESAVALPIAAAAFSVFCLRSGTVETARRLAPWLGALALYSVLRHLAGGVSAIGGASRIPKLAAFLVLLGALLALSGERWLRMRAWLRDRRLLVMGVFGLCLAGAAATAAAGGGVGRLAAGKLAVAGFSIVNLLSPILDVSAVPFYLAPGTIMYWLGGVLSLAVAAAIVAAGWRRLLEDDRLWFLAALLAAAALPISALTEGTRYLYLPSAVVSLIAGVAIADAKGPRRRAALVLVALVLALSAGQIVVKLSDWIWAGRLADDGARLVDGSLAPACGQGHVVFLTEPVAIRGVYTHFLYETFELPRGCMPAKFDVLARVVRADATIDVRWRGPASIEITETPYRNNFVLSQDLRKFDRPVIDGAAVALSTPLGQVRAEGVAAAERVTLTLSPEARQETIRFFYYSAGQIRPLAAVSPTQPSSSK